jgi:hypothetical protein
MPIEGESPWHCRSRRLVLIGAALLIVASLQVRFGTFRGTCHGADDRRLYRRIRDELEVALLGPVYFRLGLRSRR